MLLESIAQMGMGREGPSDSVPSFELRPSAQVKPEISPEERLLRQWKDATTVAEVDAVVEGIISHDPLQLPILFMGAQAHHERQARQDPNKVVHYMRSIYSGHMEKGDPDVTPIRTCMQKVNRVDRVASGLMMAWDRLADSHHEPFDECEVTTPEVLSAYYDGLRMVHAGFAAETQLAAEAARRNPQDLLDASLNGDYEDLRTARVGMQGAVRLVTGLKDTIVAREVVRACFDPGMIGDQEQLFSLQHKFAEASAILEHFLGFSFSDETALRRHLFDSHGTYFPSSSATNVSPVEYYFGSQEFRLFMERATEKVLQWLVHPMPLSELPDTRAARATTAALRGKAQKITPYVLDYRVTQSVLKQQEGLPAIAA